MQFGVEMIPRLSGIDLEGICVDFSFVIRSIATLDQLIMSYFLGNRDRAVCRHACTVSILSFNNLFFLHLEDDGDES